jgi:AraC family transcriptional regulator of adaptative response/methylated-DNA-[protein]-cysteine methyltransferase
MLRTGGPRLPSDRRLRLCHAKSNCIPSERPQSPAYSDFGLEGIGAQTVKAIETPQLGVSLPLDLQGTPLQISVWQALQAIPIGKTARYEEIARRIGASNAVVSVLQACLDNKIAVAIPCHRVMGNHGEFGEYRWGWKRKRALVDRGAYR